MMSFLSEINLLMTGIMGLYIGIHNRAKRRPLCVVSERVGFDRAVMMPSVTPVN